MEMLLGVVDRFPGSPTLIKYTFYALSNYVACGKKYSMKFVEVGGGEALKILGEVLNPGSASSRPITSDIYSEAMWVLVNMITTARDDIVVSLLLNHQHTWILSAFEKCLSGNISEKVLLQSIIDALISILQAEVPVSY